MLEFLLLFFLSRGDLILFGLPYNQKITIFIFYILNFI